MPDVKLSSGVNIFYRYYRDGQTVSELDTSKPTVLLLHPQFSSSESWSSLVQDVRLAERYNCVTIDEKFHGNSIGPVQPGRTFQDAAEDVAEALKKLNIPPCHVVGESHSGARIAAHLALLQPDLCKSLLLISPGAFDQEDEQTLQAMQELLEIAQEAKIGFKEGSGEASCPKELLQAYIDYYFGDTIPDEIAEEEKDRFNRNFGRQPVAHIEEIFRMYIDKRKIPDLDQIKQPVMVLESTCNNIHTAKVAGEAWADAFAGSVNSEIHYLHGAPINATRMYPNVVARFLTGWLSRHADRKSL